MGREFELKYRATMEQIDAIRTFYGDFESISMETTYYDTPAGDFSRLRWTLRRRLENGRSVCTLKVPLSDGSRGEWETEMASIEEGVEELYNLSGNERFRELCSAGVVPTCGARFTRLAKLLAPEGATVELALDEGFLLGGGRKQLFAEVEVEYKSGSEEAAAAFAGELAETYALIPEPRSKIARAQALLQTQET